MQNEKALMHQQLKMKNSTLKKVCTKNRTCYYCNDIIKLEDFDLGNIFIDEKSHKNILIMTFHIKL